MTNLNPAKMNTLAHLISDKAGIINLYCFHYTPTDLHIELGTLLLQTINLHNTIVELMNEIENDKS